MAKKKVKKNPKLPNGFGSIKKLSGKNRTNPYGVYPPVTEYIEMENRTKPIQPPALTYVDNWLKGVGVLSAYHAGTYVPGQELPDYLDTSNQDDILKGIVNDFNASKRLKASEPPKETFAAVYEAYFNWKYKDDKSREYSYSSLASTRAAFKKFSALHDKPFCELRHNDFQVAIDNCGLKFSGQSNMVSLVHGMSEYADIYKIISKDESSHLKVKIQNDAEAGNPFSNKDLEILWKNKDNDIIEMLLIMCYSGYRVAAYKSIAINLEENYFQGGVKNRSSKNRVVPIHSAILPLVQRRVVGDGGLFTIPYRKFLGKMIRALVQLGIEQRTPHDCRHTFSRLCENSNVNENDRRRMLGHSFGSDVTNAVYGHRTVEDLRIEIEKIKVCH